MVRVYATDLEHKHFVKVDHLFYCFVVSESGDGVQSSVLTYLPCLFTQQVMTLCACNTAGAHAVRVRHLHTTCTFRTL